LILSKYEPIQTIKQSIQHTKLIISTNVLVNKKQELTKRPKILQCSPPLHGHERCETQCQLLMPISTTFKHNQLLLETLPIALDACMSISNDRTAMKRRGRLLWFDTQLETSSFPVNSTALEGRRQYMLYSGCWLLLNGRCLLFLALSLLCRFIKKLYKARGRLGAVRTKA